MKKIKTLYDYLPKKQRVYHNAYHKTAHYTYPEGVTDQIKVDHLQRANGFNSIRIIRRCYDGLTRYDDKNMKISKWLQRCQTVAGVPGMVGGMARHLKSFRDLQQDKGWIHNLLEQADNERFHLITFLNMIKPGYLERFFILALQGTFFNFFWVSYLLNSKFSHRYVGYLEYQAVKTYTAMLADIGEAHQFGKLRAPVEYRDYYQLPQGATMRDIIACIRADQACHRQTNHYLASADQTIEIAKEKVKVINEEKSQNIYKDWEVLKDQVQELIEREQQKIRGKESQNKSS